MRVAFLAVVLAAACGGIESAERDAFAGTPYESVTRACSASDPCPLQLKCMPSRDASSACFIEQDGTPYGGCPEGGSNVSWGWGSLDSAGNIVEEHSFYACTRKCKTDLDCLGTTACDATHAGFGVCMLPMP